MTAKNKWIHCGYIKEEEEEKEQLFVCVKCDVKCSNKYNFDRHCLSSKHNRPKEEQKEVDNDLFMCECGKKYKYSQGLSKHKLCCVLLKQDHTEELTVDSGKQLIETLLIQCAEQTRMNAELHNKVIELCKIGTINNNISNTNSNNNTTHNKTFNLQFFLNETCKDAVNLEDFIKSVVLQLSDIVKIGESGFVDGMSDIIETKLNSLGVHRRPIHCTDAKREVFYVRGESSSPLGPPCNQIGGDIQVPPLDPFGCTVHNAPAYYIHLLGCYSPSGRTSVKDRYII